MAMDRFGHFPASNLNGSFCHWLSQHLNPRMDTLSSHHLLQDWRGLGESMGKCQQDIELLRGHVNQTVQLMEEFRRQPRNTVGNLLDILSRMERHDVLEDPFLITLLERCFASTACTTTESPIQVAQVDSSESNTLPLTVSEAERTTVDKYDAYVASATEDHEFVDKLIEKLQYEEGFKLYVEHRDSLPGTSKLDAMGELIDNRCRKMIAVLSPDFIKNEDCDFMVKFACSLTPGARERKIIPVIYRTCEVPRIINFITTVDYTRKVYEKWFWRRLIGALRPGAQPGSSSSTAPVPLSQREDASSCRSAEELGQHFHTTHY